MGLSLFSLSGAAMSGILKRKFEEVEGASPCSSLRESEEEEISSTESGDSSDSVNPSASHFTHSSSASSSTSTHMLQRTGETENYSYSEQKTTVGFTLKQFSQ